MKRSLMRFLGGAGFQPADRIHPVHRPQAGFCVGIVLLLPLFALAQPAPSGNADNGKKLFLKDGCWECHGYSGQGGRDGARIGATSLTLQGVIRYVRKPTGSMPAFTDKLITDQELTDIYAYLKSLPPVKAAKDIPLLNQLK